MMLTIRKIKFALLIALVIGSLVGNVDCKKGNGKNGKNKAKPH